MLLTISFFCIEKESTTRIVVVQCGDDPCGKVIIFMMEDIYNKSKLSDRNLFMYGGNVLELLAY